jgi:hypothetical protein
MIDLAVELDNWTDPKAPGELDLDRMFVPGHGFVDGRTYGVPKHAFPPEASYHYVVDDAGPSVDCTTKQFKGWLGAWDHK